MSHAPEPPPDPVEEILAECLERDPSAVRTAVEAACSRHPELAAKLQERFAALRAMGLVEPPASAREFPERLGPFRLLRRLGGGGMGVVYLAEQEPLGRQVALKLIRPENLYFPGAHTRFAAEAGLIANLKHPGIVPVYTFGEEEGVPYFAMELVEGRTFAERIEGILHRGDRPRPSDLDRADSRSWSDACSAAVAQIARALQHAHEQGIVHRDVKPSNVIVTAEGRALLLDFGLAFREGGDRLTRSGAQPGSVAYMSPEQVRGEQVDARTDVYSLGVTFYELLSLHAPFTGGSLQDVQRRILRGAPAPLRDIDHTIARDAAVICAKAMAPERRLRYQTAAALADDLEAFLQRRPIAARPAGPWLRARRFAQRRPTLTASLAAGVLLLVGVPLLLFLQERTARIRIAQEAEIARQLSDFMVGLFAETTPDRARGETVPARVALDRGVRRIQARFDEQPVVKSTLLQAMGNAYVSLGLFAEAEPVLVEALELREAVGEESLELARCRRDLGALRHWRGELRDAERLKRRALETLSGVRDRDSPERAVFQRSLAVTLRDLGRREEAEALLRGSTEALRRAGQAARALLARNLQSETELLRSGGRYREALPIARELRTLLEELYAGDHPDKVPALELEAFLQNETGDRTAAEATFAEALRMAQAVFDPDHPRIAEVQENFASILTGLDDLPRALELLDRALQLHRRTYPPRHPTLARALFRQSRILLDLGEIAAAEHAAAEALAIAEEIWTEGHQHLVTMLVQRAWTAFQNGDLEVAADASRRAVRMAESLEVPRRTVLGDALRVLAMVEATRSDSVDAVAMAERALAIQRRWHGGDHADVALALCALAFVRTSNGDAASAVPEAEAGLAMWRRLARGPHWGVAWAEYLLGWSHLENGDLDAAEKHSAIARDLYSLIWPASHPIHGFPLNNLGVVLARRGELEAAFPCLRRALEVRMALPAASDLLAISRLNLAALQDLRGFRAEAEELANECLGGLTAGSRRAAPCLQLLARLLRARQAEASEWRRLRHRAAELLPTGHAVHDLLTEER